MRTTASSTYRTIQLAMQRSNSQLDTLYLQASTGKQLNRASDDPTSVPRVLSARSEIAGMDRHLENMALAQDRMDIVDGYLDSAETILARAQEIATAGANGSMSSEDLQTYALEVEALEEQLLNIGNIQVEGKYIFAGFSDGIEPFSGDPVSYNGTSDIKCLEIGPGQTIATNLTGDTLFSEPVDVFAALAGLEEALTNGDTAAIQSQLATLQDGYDQVSRQRSSMGNLNARLDDNLAAMEDAKLDMQEVLSRYEDVDLVEVLSDMTLAEESLQAALSVSIRVMSLSILDYL